MFKIVRSDGKTDWLLFRRTLYIMIITWVVGVRLLNMDPFDDIVNNKITFATLLDAVGLYGVWLISWHLVWPARPKISA